MSFLGSLFGSSNKSSSSTSATTSNAPQNVQSNTAPVVTGSNNSLTLTDSRSQQYAAQLAAQSLTALRASNHDSSASDAALTLNLVHEYTQSTGQAFAAAIASAQQSATGLQDFAKAASTPDATAISQNLIKYGALAVVAVALLMMGKQ